MESAAEYEYEFDPTAENNTAASVYSLAREGGPRVLDLGAGPAIVSSHLARNDDREVVAIDASTKLLAAAKSNGITETHVADLDSPERFAAVEGRQFDVIILADVLEHLLEPAAVLDEIRERKMLADDGFLVVSIPNAAHESVLAELLGDRFEYRPTGLLDETHIRWFTRRSFEELAQRAGFLVTRTARTTRTLEQTEMAARTTTVDASVRKQLHTLNPELNTYQYVMRVEPCAAGPELARLRADLDRATERGMKAQHEQHQLVQQQLAQAQANLESAKVQHETALAEASAVLDEERAETARLQRQLTEAHAAQRAGVEDLEAQLSTLEIAARAGRADMDLRVAAKDEEIDDLREQLRERERELDVEIQTLRASLQTERDAALKQLTSLDKRAQAAIDEAVAKERQKSRTHIESLQGQLDALLASNTWRAGSLAKSLATNPVRAVKTLRQPTPVEDDPADIPKPADPGSAALPLLLAPDLTKKLSYERSVARRSFVAGEGHDAAASTTAARIVFAVSTADLSEGRGDLYVAAGLGRELERRGHAVAYLPRQGWDKIPDATDVVVAMLPTFDPLAVPPGTRSIAWIRNETESWAKSGRLPIFDGVLSSSAASLDELAPFINGPTEILGIGADIELFAPPAFAGAQRRGVVTTVNQWGRTRDTYAALQSAPIDFDLAILGEARQFDPNLVPFSLGARSYFELPSAYRQARIVLDDLNHTTKAYGNVNSRVFEALAAGALVVSNSSNGLAELGLGDVPTYDRPEDLHDLIHQLLAEPEETDRRAQHLAGVVRQRHSFAARADSFDAFLAKLRGQVSRSDAIVAWYPPERSSTATVERRQLAEQGIAVVSLDDLRSITIANKTLASGRPFALVVDLDSALAEGGDDELGDLRRRQELAAELDRIRGSQIPIVAMIDDDAARRPLSAVEQVARRDVLSRSDALIASRESADRLLFAASKLVDPAASGAAALAEALSELLGQSDRQSSILQP